MLFLERECYAKLAKYGPHMLLTCCNGNLVFKYGSVTYCCGSRSYDPLRQMCCGNRVYTKWQRYTLCCNNKVFLVFNSRLYTGFASASGNLISMVVISKKYNMGLILRNVNMGVVL